MDSPIKENPVIVHCIKRNTEGELDGSNTGAIKTLNTLYSITDNGIIMPSQNGEHPRNMLMPNWAGEHGKLKVVYTYYYNSFSACTEITNTYWEYVIILDAKKLCDTSPSISAYKLDYQYQDTEKGFRNTAAKEALLLDLLNTPLKNGQILGFGNPITFTRSNLIAIVLVPRTPPPDPQLRKLKDAIFEIESKFFYGKHRDEKLGVAIASTIDDYTKLREIVLSSVNSLIRQRKKLALEDVIWALENAIESGTKAKDNYIRLTEDQDELEAVIEITKMFRGYHNIENESLLFNSLQIVTDIVSHLTKYANVVRIAIKTI
jgi:hypothetical protein